MRDLGLSGGGAEEVGGGGSGALFASPMRSSVIVSCAFVGTPLRSVLSICQRTSFLVFQLGCLLSDFQKFLPVGKFVVQPIKSTPDDWISKETQAN